MAADIVVGQLTTFGSLEFFATGGFEDSTTLLDDIGNVLGLEINNLVGDKSAVTAVNTLYLETAEDSRTGYGTDSGVHSGGITSGSQYTYTFKLCHDKEIE